MLWVKIFDLYLISKAWVSSLDRIWITCVWFISLLRMFLVYWECFFKQGNYEQPYNTEFLKVFKLTIV